MLTYYFSARIDLAFMSFFGAMSLEGKQQFRQYDKFNGYTFWSLSQFTQSFQGVIFS